MSRRLIDVVRRANQTREPEHSVALRAAVLGAVLTGVGALVGQGAISPLMGAVAFIALASAYYVSWVRRSKDNFALKLVLTLAAIVALSRFLGGLGRVQSFDQVRFPLAELFLWVQVLHGLDLPQRKDLSFSLGSSLALMAVAGSLAQDSSFALFVTAYAAFGLTALVLAHRSELREGTAGRLAPVGPASHAAPWRQVAVATIATMTAATVLFLVIPQPVTTQTFALPFSLGSGIGTAAGGGIANPGFDGDPTSRSGGLAYYGFAERMDLRVRGDLPDDVVMRLRTSTPSMLRGMLFDHYDGVAWEGSRADPARLPESTPASYPAQFRSPGPAVAVSQTFYVEAEGPSAIFAAAHPDAIWYEGGVSVDDNGALRTDSTLTEGTVYSVVSSRGAASPAELRRAGDPEPVRPLERYLHVPPSVPERVRRLARSLTRGESNDYDRVKAIERYLAEHFRYDIQSPVPPPGRDAVDYFLFDSEVGFCEQFASATAIMLRSLGIPARVAVGFTPGTRNAFSGYYEVRASDAHAWVEVFFPGYGWYEFDPTFDVPPADAAGGSVIPIVRLIESLLERLSSLPSGGVRFLRVALAAAFVVTAALGMRRLAARRRPLDGRGPAVALSGGPVARAFARFDEAMAGRGVGRAPPETAAEVTARAERLAGVRAGGALKAFEAEAYGRTRLRAREEAEAVAEWHRLAAAVAPPPERDGSPR